ncbi:MAG: lipopolysaccharide biosynthesis protein [Vicinamibacterales bacterium]
MSSPGPAAWHRDENRFLTFARNVSTRYVGIVVGAIAGLLVLPINIHYLGRSAYGLWMLTASITAYFSVLELGYGSAVIRFVAEYRARRDVRALNEILSTLFTVFTVMGVIVYAIAIVVAWFLPAIFNLEPGQVDTGRVILLIIAANVAIHFVFAVYGGVVNGFERYYLNNVIGTAAMIAVAAVNVVVLWLGYGLIELVVATTLVRMAPYYLYRRNARAVFPALRLSFRLFRRERLREVTGFSIYLAIIDWSSRLNYALDAFTIGIFLNTAAVGVYSVGLRLSEALFRMTNQLHTFLFPAVVQQATEGRIDAQRQLLVQATRFQLAVALALCGMVIGVADVLIRTWVGPGFDEGVLTAQLLAFVVVLRAWMGIPGTVLKGSGRPGFVAGAAAGCAVANVLLSVLLVNVIGLVGVALGTVIPVTIVAAFAIFPAACRAVELSVPTAYRRIVWPAVWPALVAIAAVALTRHLIPLRLAAVLAHMAIGALAYAALFLTCGLERDERQWLTTKLNELWKRRSQVLAAA